MMERKSESTDLFDDNYEEREIEPAQYVLVPIVKMWKKMVEFV